MCGINGIFAYRSEAAPVDLAELVKTRDYMRKRGPDGLGEWISGDGRVGLGHRRLAVIDLSDAAAQPMASECQRFVITYNGEIYNYRELRAELKSKGYRFRTQSDTEVLLHLFAEKGVEMLRDLRGMYAFAIWDQINQSLFLARDPFGIKPLYLSDDGKTVRFASQLKALIASGAVGEERSPVGDMGYWVWGHVPEPHTLYRDVMALEPGCWRIFSRDGAYKSGHVETVADIFFGGNANEGAVQERFSNLREALLDTVRHHLISDVPVGLFLSAGIDSTALLALATECGAHIKTVTLGFSEFRGTPQDETVLAKAVAEHYGAQHQTVWIEQRDFEAALDVYLADMDQPSIDGLNSWLVCRAGAQLGFKVALSGLGSDEIFGGYPSFHQLPKLKTIAQPFGMVPGLGRMLRKIGAPVLGRFTSRKYASLFEYGKTWQGAYMLRRAIRMPWEGIGAVPAEWHQNQKSLFDNRTEHLVVSYLETTQYMRNQLLRDADWASMAHSVELRVPFVDKVLARYMAHQSARSSPFRKQDLAASARPALPLEITRRRKTGFGVPVRTWMMDRFSLVPERGLRPWQTFVHSRFGMKRSSPERTPTNYSSVALWVPEIAAFGGVQSYMWRIWEMLLEANSRTGIDVKGLALRGSPNAINTWPHSSRLRPVGMGGSKARFVLSALWKKGRADLVIVGHVNQSPVALWAQYLGFIRNYVVVLHGIEAWRRTGWLTRQALKHAHLVVATTRFTATICSEVNDLPSDNFCVIPLCAEPVPEKPDHEFRLDGEWPVLFVARLATSERYKGLEVLIDVIAALQLEGVPVKLHIVGDGDDRDRLERYARTRMPNTDGVMFHGRLSGAKMQAAYKSAKAFVMPSAKEGFGIVFLEAMRHGLACIGGASGGTPEVFTDGAEGLLVPFRNSAALRSSILRLIKDPEFARDIGIAARERFMRDYQFDDFAKRWMEMLQLSQQNNETLDMAL